MNQRPPSMLARALRLFGRLPRSRVRDGLLRRGVRLIRTWPSEAMITARDGRRFQADLRDPACRWLYLTGSYEPDETEVVRVVVRPGDTVVDAGANIGWYTTLCAVLVGAGGHVHAFEPVPPICDELDRNVRLNGLSDRVRINRVALGERRTRATVHLFRGLPHGHASLATLGRDDFVSFDVAVTSLDEYAAEHGVGRVDFIKCDVEGSELELMRGATRLIGAGRAPVWMFEINRETASARGYDPLALFETLGAARPYFFYRIVRGGRLRKVGAGSECGHGDNVLAIPAEGSAERLEAIAELSWEARVPRVPRISAWESGRRQVPQA